MAHTTFLGELEVLVLLAVMQLGDKADGVLIAEEIQTRTGRSVTFATVYGALDRLERDGLLLSRMGEATAGCANRYFTPSKTGMKRVSDTQSAGF